MLLELKKLTVRFGGLTAVNEVNCRLDEHQIVSIIGPNGAGKTTVFNAVTGIYEPTEGSIEFDGRPLVRPMNWRVAWAALLIGLATALAAALASMNVDRLWQVAIKRNYAGPGQPFSYTAAWRSAQDYLAGRLEIVNLPGGRWAVVTADARRTLTFADSEREAQQICDQLNALADELTLDSAAVLGADSPRTAETLIGIRRQATARRRTALLGLLFGFIVGVAGTFAVWNRARRSPDYISRSGIARTFQNIRLFHNMTVLENVLSGMERRFRAGLLRMAFRTPMVRHEEAAARAAAQDWLRFVGLQERAGMLAKNLSYGEQRRLEIARALATEPKVLLLDEPAAGMNPAESADLARLIDSIRGRGYSVLLIEHHMRVVMGISDRIVVLDYGSKIAEGTPAEVRVNPAVIRAYLGSEEVG